MEGFGQYKIVDELSRGPFGRVVRAKSDADSRKRFAIKIENTVVHEDFSGGFDDSSPAADAPPEPSKDPLHRAFLEGAEVQRSAATFGSNWAAIYDVGECAEGVYYVTDFIRRSARSLLTARTKVSASTLHQIACGVVSGLCDLRDACQRAHGNLKPSNILLDDRSKLGRLRIKLTDPAGNAAIPPVEADDIQALGALLYQLVTQREFRPFARLDVDSEEGSGLGRHAGQWCEFCNDLVNPDPALRPGLDEMRARLARLKPRENLQRKILAAALVVFVALITGGFIVHLLERSAEREVSVARDHWLGSLMSDGERRKNYGTMLPEPVIKPDEMKELGAYFDTPHASYPSVTGLQAKWQAVDDVRKIQNRLARVRETCLKDLRQKEDEFKGLGWTQPEEQVRQLISATDSADQPSLDKLDSLYKWDSGLPELDKLKTKLDWDVLDRALREMAQTGHQDSIVLAQVLREKAAKSIKLNDLKWTDEIEDKIQVARNATARKSIPESDTSGNVNPHPTTIASVPTTTKVETADSGAAHATPPDMKQSAAQAFIDTQRNIRAIRLTDPNWAMPQLEKFWHEQIERAWLDQRENALSALEKNPELLAEISGQVMDLPKTYVSLAEPLRQMDSTLAFNPALPAPGQGGWRADFEHSIASERQKQLAAALAEIPTFDAGKPELVKQYCVQRTDAYKSWCEQIAKVREALVHVQGALDIAYLPDETPAGSAKPVRQWMADGRQSLNPATGFLSPFVEKAEARLKQVNDLSAVNAKDALVRATAQTEPVMALGAWRQLGKLKESWPATIEDFIAEMGIQDRIGKDVLPVRGDLKTELQAERSARWDNHLRLLGHAGPATVEATVAWAAGNLTRLPVPPNAMPAWFQFDLLLYKYKSDKNLQANDSGFREAITPLRTAPSVNNFLGRFEDHAPVAAPVTPENAVVRLVKRPLPNSICFIGLDGKINITFIHVVDKNNRVPPFYMSTTEVPIGWFGDIPVQSPTRRNANNMLRLLPANAQQPQNWVGPHGWEIDRASLKVVPRRDMWCDDFHFKNGQRPVPNADHPMQCVTPEAALFMARLIGCRLPSVDEWNAAYAYSKEQADKPENKWVMQAWKLRDAVWAAECLDAAQQGASRWLDDGIFLGPGGPVPRIKIHADALNWNDTASDGNGVSPAQRLIAERASTVSNIDPRMRASFARLNALAENNSVLFRSVSYNFNDSFHDLVGNVAEYVLDNDSALRSQTDVPAEDPDKVAAFLQSPDTRVYVIGGSALSPPELGFDKPWQVTPDRTKNGFTDVGFRLAFSESVTRPPRHIDLAKAQYLTSDALPRE